MTRSKGPSYGGEDEARRLRRWHTPEPIRTVDGATNDLPATQQMLYPALWGAVHRAWNAWADTMTVIVEPKVGGRPARDLIPWLEAKGVAMPTCPGPDDGAYDPEQHPVCFDLAGALRVELHAAGLWIEAKGAIE